MKFACVIRLKGTEQYLGSDLKECEREEAPIERMQNAMARAHRRFGHQWQSKAEVVEVEYDEWMRHIAARGGKIVTPRKKQHLRRLANRNLPFRAWRIKRNDQQFYVVERSHVKASAMLRETEFGSICNRTFATHAKPCRRVLYGVPGSDKRGVWLKNGTGWKKLV